MFKKILTLILFIAFLKGNSQNEVDALRFSLFENYNTAGVSALGGAGGMLSPTQNPASLAFFTGDKLLSISLGNNTKSVDAVYTNNSTLTETPFNIAPFIQNVGYVRRLPFSTESDWNRFNMSVSFNRKHDFNNTTIVNGYNDSNSRVNIFVNNAQGFNPEELTSVAEEQFGGINYWPGYLGYYTWLINPENDDNTNYYSNTYASGQDQRMEINETGYINEVDIAFSGAYKDFLFLGGSIGFTELKFTQYKSYSEDEFEQPPSVNSSAVDRFEYNEYLETDGSGINFKFGSLIKPTDFLRLGWAYHSKTYSQLDELYETSMETHLLNGENYELLSPWTWTKSYELNTPAKSITSLGLIGNYDKLRVVFTFDYEAIDYGSSKLNPTSPYGYNFIQENEDISESYARTNNKKVGLSLSMQNISLRGGYSIFGSPFQNNLNDGEREYFSGGIGLKKGQYSFDLALIHSTKQEDYTLYQDETLNTHPTANINYQNTTVILTCNYRF